MQRVVRTVLWMIGLTDMVLFLGVLHVSRWLEEWLSVPQAAIERTLIVTYAVPFATTILQLARERPFQGATWWLVAPVLGSWAMWRNHRAGDTRRRLWFLSSSGTFFRVGSMGFWLLQLWCAALPPRRWTDWQMPLCWGSLVAFEYMVCLPKDGGGERGRKRKLALDKVKALFGTSWMPVPAR